MMSPPATPHWIAPDPKFRSGVRRIVAMRVAATALAVLAMSLADVKEITVTTNLDNLSANNNSNNLVPPPASDATVHFNNANIGPVGASYSENGYRLSSSAPGGMDIQSTMNDSHGLGVAGTATATVDLTKADELFNLQGFANQINRARFENLTSQGVVLDNIYAIPEPSTALLAVLGAFLIGAQNSFRAKSKKQSPIHRFEIE